VADGSGSAADTRVGLGLAARGGGRAHSGSRVGPAVASAGPPHRSSPMLAAADTISPV